MLFRAFQIVFVTAMAALLVLGAVAAIKNGDKKKSAASVTTIVQPD